MICVCFAGLVNPAGIQVTDGSWYVFMMQYKGCFGSDCPLQVSTLNALVGNTQTLSRWICSNAPNVCCGMCSTQQAKQNPSGSTP